MTCPVVLHRCFSGATWTQSKLSEVSAQFGSAGVRPPGLSGANNRGVEGVERI